MVSCLEYRGPKIGHLLYLAPIEGLDLPKSSCNHWFWIGAHVWMMRNFQATVFSTTFWTLKFISIHMYGFTFFLSIEFTTAVSSYQTRNGFWYIHKPTDLVVHLGQWKLMQNTNAFWRLMYQNNHRNRVKGQPGLKVSLICVMYSISVLTVVQHNSDSIQSMYNRDGKSGSVVFWYR